MFRRKRGSSPKKSSVEDAVDRTFVQSGLNKKQAGKSSLRNDLTDISKQDLSSRIDDFTYFDRDPVDTIADGWPVQILCHGSVFQVPWNTQFTESSESLDIDASVGINQEEAIAAMISGELLQDGHIDQSKVHSIETFLVGFAHGIVGQMDEPDGIHRFQSAIHRETFDSISSGIIFDYAKEEMDLLERRPKSSLDSIGKIAEQHSMENQMSKLHSSIAKSEENVNRLIEFDKTPFERELLELNKLPTAEATGSTLPSEPSAATPHAVEYAAPRYYEARDPIMLLTNSRRSTRHGGDGIFEDDGRLRCRSTRKPFSSSLLISHIDTISGEDGFRLTNWDRTNPISSIHRSVPADCRQLLWELQNISVSLENSKYYEDFSQYISGETPEHWKYYTHALPSPVGLNLWKHQAWVPIIADLRMTYTPESGGWSMGDYDFELDSNSPSEPGNPIEFERRIPITHSTGRILANRLERFLEEEAELDTDGEGVLSPQDASAMEIMRQEYISRDLISISLSSIDEAIDEFSADLAIRSGRLIVDDISVIDAFGQVIEFQTSDVLNKVRVGLSLETPDDSPGELLIKPRIPRGARLNLRLLSNDEDDAEANSGSSILELDPDDDMIPPARSPVCGFLLPDHIEWAMEVFDSNGEPKGQLRVADRHWGHMGIQKGKLAWDLAPGKSSPPGALPESGNIHMDRLLHSLINIGLIDDIERGKWDDLDEDGDGEIDEDEMGDFSGTNTGEGVLSSLLRAIDTSNWHSDPYGKGGDDYPVFYMGRPVAVVRAVLRLEVSQTTPMPENLKNHHFEVRLGAIQNRLDGLLGYFINDDYSRFNAVYPIQNGQPAHPETSIDHEFLDFDPTLEIRPEQDVYLTLLMNPQSAVHVTSGILPQKEIVLLREHWQDAVAKIAPSFKVGPVLVDPTSVRMPIDDMKPNLIWKWTHRETPSEWIEGPIRRSDSLAGLPHGKMTAYEGWIKLDIDESHDSGN